MIVTYCSANDRDIPIQMSACCNRICAKHFCEIFVIQDQTHVIHSVFENHKAIAEPGFPRGGCDPQRGDANLFGKIFTENSMKMREIGPRAGAHPQHPLPPRFATARDTLLIMILANTLLSSRSNANTPMQGVGRCCKSPGRISLQAVKHTNQLQHKYFVISVWLDRFQHTYHPFNLMIVFIHSTKENPDIFSVSQHSPDDELFPNSQKATSSVNFYQDKDEIDIEYQFQKIAHGT